MKKLFVLVLCSLLSIACSGENSSNEDTSDNIFDSDDVELDNNAVGRELMNETFTADVDEDGETENLSVEDDGTFLVDRDGDGLADEGFQLKSKDLLGSRRSGLDLLEFD